MEDFLVKREEAMSQVKTAFDSVFQNLAEQLGEVMKQVTELSGRMSQLETKVEKIQEEQNSRYEDFEKHVHALEEQTAGNTDAIKALPHKFQAIGSDRILIQPNADLNTIFELGNYKCPANTTTVTIANRPAGLNMAFTMTVGCATGEAYYLFQEITEFLHGTKYYRWYCTGDWDKNKHWTAWEKKN